MKQARFSNKTNKSAALSKFYISIFTFIIIYSGCKTTVNLVLKTNDKVTHSSTIVLKDKNKILKEELSGGMISADLSDTILFKLGKKEFFQVKSSLTSGDAIIYSSPDISPDRKANPFNYEMELKTNIDLLNDSISIATLKGSLMRAGVNNVTNSTNFSDAADNIIGSLIVVAKDSAGRYTVLHSVRPSIFGVRKMKLEDVKWQDTREQGNTYITGSMANNANATIPLFAKFGAAFENDKVYNLRWSMNGYGKYLKPDEVSPSMLIQTLLRFEDVSRIRTLLTKNKKVKVYYINQVYLLKNAELFTQEAKKAETSVNEASSVISDNVVYTFENAEEKYNLLDCQVLYYWGNEYSFKFPKQKVYSAKRATIKYQIKYSIYNLNKSEIFSPDIFH